MEPKNYIIFIIVYMILDLLWITMMSSMYYNEQIAVIQNSEPKYRYMYALMAYVALVFVLLYVCIPLADSKVYPSSMIAFAVVGFSIYGIFNLTNAAIFERYPYHFVAIDTLWGSVAFGFMGLVYDLLNR